MRRRSLLLGVLLVAIVVVASGCSGSILAPIIRNPEADAVDAVVDAFVVAMRNQDDEQMEELLGWSVSSDHDMGWLGVQTGTLTRRDFASGWTSLWIGEGIDVGVAAGVVPKFSVTDLRFTQGPSITVTGSAARATGKILWTLDYPDNWYYDMRLDIEPIGLIEDIYSVEFGLQKSGSNWLITSFKMEIGERQSAISDVWETFAEGFADQDAGKVLSSCRRPFRWTGVRTSEWIPLGTHYEWRECLDDLFAVDSDIDTGMDLTYVVVMNLDAWSGAIRGCLTVGSGIDEAKYLAEITFSRHGDTWLMDGIHLIRLLDI